MKKNLTPVLYVGIGILAGIVLTLAYQNTTLSKDLTDLVRPAQSCTYNGVTYAEGDAFMDADNCNTCSCSGGVVACTLMYCEPDSDAVVESDAR